MNDYKMWFALELESKSIVLTHTDDARDIQESSNLTFDELKINPNSWLELMEAEEGYSPGNAILVPILDQVLCHINGVSGQLDLCSFQATPPASNGLVIGMDVNQQSGNIRLLHSISDLDSPLGEHEKRFLFENHTPTRAIHSFHEEVTPFLSDDLVLSKLSDVLKALYAYKRRQHLKQDAVIN